MNSHKVNQIEKLGVVDDIKWEKLRKSKGFKLSKVKRLIKRVILYAVLIVAVLITIIPLWSGIMSAFKTQADLSLTSPIAPPLIPTLEPFIYAWLELQRPLINSVLFTTIATVISCLLGSVCGFVLTKLKFKGSKTLFMLFTIGIFLPYQSILVPLFITIRNLGIYDTMWAMILVHSVYGIPMTTLLFRSYYDSIPESLINAAKTDGAGVMAIYRRLIIPLSPLPFVVAGVFQFTSIWNDYLFALILTGANFEPASFALSNMAGGTETAWNNTMAGTFLYSLPVLLIFVLLGKYLMQGLMAGAIKG
ncbi:MAG: carbohydrate ABC transporter permease [Candidatus Lokiarchaeota archaeon]|nr:carbohydrate ABC transporter permease [Candidatus Lokiarchaeota archaeon]